MAGSDEIGVGASPEVKAQNILQSLFEEEMTPAELREAAADAEAQQEEPPEQIDTKIEPEGGEDDAEQEDAAQSEESDSSEEEVLATEEELVEEAEEVAEPQPAIAPPVGMTAEAAAQFAELTPEMQQFLVQQEAYRQADYSRKSQEIAEQKRQAEALQSHYEQQLQQQQEVLSNYIDGLDVPYPDQALSQDDPVEYVKQMGIYNEAQRRKQTAQQDLQKVQAEQQRQVVERYNKFVETEAEKLKQIIPDFNDPVKAQQLQADLTKHALDSGIAQERIDLLSADEVKLIYDSWKLNTAQQVTKKKPVAKKMPPKAARARGTESKGTTDLRQLEAVKKKIAEDGKVQDLATLYTREVR